MKIIHIIQGISDLSAGPTYSVGEISHFLNSYDGNTVSIFSLGNGQIKWKYDTELYLFNSWVNRIKLVSFKAILFYLNCIKQKAIVHEHGIWRSLNLLPILGKGHSILVWSPRGMFSSWSMKHHSLIKKPFWFFFQKPALERVDCFHATSDDEVEDIRRLGFKQPVALIPNGVRLPSFETFKVEKQKNIVFLSRIHTKKGVHLLIKAWNAVAREFPGWHVTIAGTLRSSYAEEMQALATNLKIPRINFIGGVFNDKKSKLLANASVFVLPTYSENFGIAIAEALAHSTPVITTVHTPWLEIEERHCGWCIEADETELATTLKKVLNKSVTELSEMGINGRKWMETDFSWEEQAFKMHHVYKWLMGEDERPSCINTISET